MKIFVTGVGSVMGMSIVQALQQDPGIRRMQVMASNSELGTAGEVFVSQKWRGSVFIESPLAASEGYLDFMRSLFLLHQPAIIFPGTQHELLKLSELRDEGFPVACPPLSIVELCIDKFALAQFLKARGIPHPETQLAEEGGRNFPGKIVAKPRTGSASRGIFILDDGNSVQQFLELRASNYILQEYVEGPEFTCSLYLDRVTGEIKTLQLQRELSIDGASSKGQVTNLEEVNLYLFKIARELRNVGWDFGHINVQLRLANDGPKLIEINPRLSSTESPKAKLGFNTCAASFQNIALNQSSNLGTPSEGARFIRYYEELIFP